MVCEKAKDKGEIRKSIKSIMGELINAKTGERFEIHQNHTIIGRAEDCQIIINDPVVSRKHASLSFQNGKVILEDLGSGSGTRVNLERIHKKVLRNGYRILMGETDLIFNV